MYLDKDSDVAQKLTEKYLSDRDIKDLKNSDIRKLSNDYFKRLLVTHDCDALFKGCFAVLNHLIQFEKPVERDRRVEKAIAFISDTRDKQFRVKDVAKHVNLSESRLRHLFKEQVGQPVQNFILWMKVVDSLNLVLKGQQLTRTAHETGFFDSSHMNRSYREILGVAPGAIKKFEDELRIISCGDSNFYTFKTEILKDWNANQPIKVIET